MTQQRIHGQCYRVSIGHIGSNFTNSIEFRGIYFLLLEIQDLLTHSHHLF